MELFLFRDKDVVCLVLQNPTTAEPIDKNITKENRAIISVPDYNLFVVAKILTENKMGFKYFAMKSCAWRDSNPQPIDP
jgi:hypothetical protein